MPEAKISIQSMRDSRTKIVSALSASALLASTVFFFGPTYMYYTNNVELPFLYQEAAPSLAVLSVVAASLLAVLSLVWQRGHQAAVSLMFTISLLAWVQAYLLAWNYGPLDGRQIDWQSMRLWGFIDSALWISALLFAVLKSSTVYRVTPKLSALVVTVQIASVIVAVIQSPAEPSNKRYAVDVQHKYSFSSQENVIIIVLDMFQTDVFQEIVSETRSYGQFFEGFTYFRNALGGFPTTYASEPLILTGKQYDNSVPFRSFLEAAYHSESSLPKVLKRNGYQVDLYGLPKLAHFDEDIASNVRQKKLADSLAYEPRHLNLLTSLFLLRSFPHFLKKHVYEHVPPVPAQQLEDNLSFIEEFKKECKVSQDGKTFKYFHLIGTHAPFTLNERLQTEDLPQDRTGYRKQAKAVLTIVGLFLDTLKQHGVFDNSLIVVIGDHGYPWPGMGVRLPADMAYRGDGASPIPEAVRGSALPLILVKPFHTGGPMAVSDAPVSLSDIPRTVFHALGINNRAEGYSFFDITASDRRVRRFLSYDNTIDKDSFFGDLEEYTVSGFSWLAGSWRKTHRVFTRHGVKYRQPQEYRYGREIRFGERGDAVQYQGEGWGLPSDKVTWAEGKSASLHIPITPSDRDMELRAALRHFIGNGSHMQRVTVSVKNDPLGRWGVTSTGEYRAVIPRNYLAAGEVEIVFDLPDAVSPRSLGMNEDTRVLSVGFESLAISERSFYEYGHEIRFGERGDAVPYQGEGWGAARETVTWTEGKRASLRIPVTPSDRDMELRASLRHFIGNGSHRQRVVVSVNKKRAGRWVVTSKGEYRAVIPRNYLAAGEVEIVFELPDAVSPKSLGINEDVRVLSVGFESLVISKEDNQKDNRGKRAVASH